MSLGFQSCGHQSLGLSPKNGADILHFESPPSSNLRQATAVRINETKDISPRLRFSSLTLAELSEELDRRTKETQRLQEEVENATREALEKFGCTFGISSSDGQSYHKQRVNLREIPDDFTVFSTHQQALTQPCVQDSLNQLVVQSDINCAGKEVLDNTMDDCVQQFSDLQLSKIHDQSEQQTFSLDRAILNLQTKLHKVEMEKDVQSDLRLKDSRKHADQMEKMLSMLEELQKIKRAADEKRPNIDRGSIQLSPAATITEEFRKETDQLQGRVFSKSVEHLRSEERNGINEQKRMDDLIASLGQEVELLTDRLSSSKNNSVSLKIKLDLLQKLAEGQTSLYQCEVRDLESAVSSHKDKICFLEQQLIQAQSQLMEVQREKEQTLQQAEVLQSQLGQLKKCAEQQHFELQVEMKALRGSLEASREQLCQAGEKNTCLQALLEQRVQEWRKSQQLLQEKEEELQLRQEENHQHLSSLEKAQSKYQTLHEEGETLRLQLEDREKRLNILRLQIHGTIQTVEQHSHTIDNLHQDNSLLSNQLNQHKLEIQQLRGELEKHKSDLAAAEHEKRQLQASVVELRQQVQEETLEKQKLITQLEVQFMKLNTLTKEHKELQQMHSCRKEEQQGVLLELQSQLRDTHDELDQVRSNLRTLEGAEGHALQVAMDMQTEITVKREQVDSLQGKTQHLKEAMEKLHQEKLYQNLENQRHLQELMFIREEKRLLALELEAFRTKDQQLRERISDLEAILHKMSGSFANCQDFIQQQEQEFFRLKLQHALDLKELRGKNLHAAAKEPLPVLNSSAGTDPFPQHVSNTQTKSKRQQENPTQDLRSLVKELRGAISENHRPHTDNSVTDNRANRRRSAPGRVHSTAYEPHLLMTAEPNGKIIGNKYFGEITSSPQLFSLGRRSPVHCLLTSDPNS
ncbi:coiled-coil domain-containing protein 158-like isoform X2 [Channa argus]|uniref:coiled-coil domain-containing protein 158-like isoform X2 n=1 Tax=Channa argus TaxID=215402 RepID=UPI0035223B8B